MPVIKSFVTLYYIISNLTIVEDSKAEKFLGSPSFLYYQDPHQKVPELVNLYAGELRSITDS